MSPRIMGDLLLANTKSNPFLTGKNVIDIMKIGYGFDVPYWKARRAAEIAKVKVYGSFSDSYDQLRYYARAVELSNPGSVMVLETNPRSNRFERAFFALNASIHGFRSCAPLLFVDGTFLRGPFKGIILVAIAKDGNKGLFPVAVAVVSTENTPNWTWFLKNVRDSAQHSQKIYYLSDRNSGLMAAFPIVFDEPVHFFCLFHLLQNLKGKYCKGLSKKNRATFIRLFKECAYEPVQEKFEEKLKEFRVLGGRRADEWLSQLPPEKWAVCFAPQLTKYGEMTSNTAESFNSWILTARCMPITKMFDFVRSGLSKWFVERRGASSSWTGSLVPTKEVLWNHLSNVGSAWQVVACPGEFYEVLSCPTTHVNLNKGVCSCSQWQASGFPCCHAVAVICKVRDTIFQDVEPYFLSSKYQECYKVDINPVPETLINEIQSKANLPKILPPTLSRPIGRPKAKKRIPSVGEFPKNKLQTRKCLHCGEVAKHDHWTCGTQN